MRARATPTSTRVGRGAGRRSMCGWCGRREPGSAARADPGDPPADEVTGHRVVDALVALAERGVLLAVDDEQAAPVELPRQGLGLDQRSGRVAGGADDEDRW